MPHRTRTFVALAAAGACLLLGPPAASAATCPGDELEATEQSQSAIEDSILCLINDRRSNAGLAPVRPNFKLDTAAARHSRDMVARGFFGHTSPGGDSFIDRISSTGYMRGARSWLVGENLVWGSGSLSTPASLVQAWMESPPHRANLMRGRFREIGLSGARGTPSSAGDEAGITVSSEYGYRAMRKGANKSRKSRARRS